MIKRIGIFGILLAYLIVTAGFTVDTHFCGNQIAEVSFNSVSKSCGMAMNCCHDKHLDVKSDKHQTVSKAANTQPLAIDLFFVASFLNAQQDFSSRSPLCAYSSPPIHPGIPLTIINSVFRI